MRLNPSRTMMSCPSETLFQDKIDTMVWSYSRVKSYFECPRMFYLTYIDTGTLLDSAFSQWGSLCHELLDRYAKGELLAFELSEEYDRMYPEVMTERFPTNKWADMDAQYYDRGKEFFDTFDGFPDNWVILGSEIEIEVTIRGHCVRGIIDLLVQDRSDGMLILVDHKSKSKFKSAQELEQYGYQMYFYAVWVYHTYGAYPKEMIFNMFRAGTQEKIHFTMEGLEKACDWLEENVSLIYADEDFKDKVTLRYSRKSMPVPENRYPDFFCRCLCGVRHRCARSGLCIDGGML